MITFTKEQEKALLDSATAVKCAFCNRPAVRWHAPAPINGKTFAGIPLCDSKCNTIPKRKRP